MEEEKGPEVSKKNLSPGIDALIIVDFEFALACSFARARDPQGNTVPVSV